MSGDGVERPKDEGDEGGRWSLDRKQFLRRGGVTLAGAGALTFLAACSDDNKTENAGAQTDTDSSPASGGGGSINDKYKNLNIGIAHYTTADEGETALAAAFKEAAEKADLGWQIKESDSQADPGKMQQVVNAFITQKVDAIVDMVIPSRLIAAELDTAKKANIPVFGLWTFSERDPNMAVDYTPIPAADEACCSNYMFSDLYQKHPSGDIKIALLDTDLDSIAQRTNVLEGLIKLYPRVKVVDKANVDLTDAVGSATKIANAFMSKNSDLAAIWVNYPPAAVPASAAVQTRNKADQIGLYYHIAGKAGTQALKDKTNPTQAMVLVDLDYQSYKIAELIMRNIKGEKLPRLLSYEEAVPMRNFTKDTSDDLNGEGVAFGAGWTRDAGAWKDPLVESWKSTFSS